MTDRDVHNYLCTAAGYAQWFIGVPDAVAMSALLPVKENLRADLERTLGAEVATTVAEAFAAAVIAAKHESRGRRRDAARCELGERR